MDGSSFLWRIKMAYTDISICSNALLKIGAESITSFLDGTAEAEVAANLYPMIRDGLLASYPWSFAVGQKSLPRLAGVPLADYSYAYRLPNDFLRCTFRRQRPQRPRHRIPHCGKPPAYRRVGSQSDLYFPSARKFVSGLFLRAFDCPSGFGILFAADRKHDAFGISAENFSGAGKTGAVDRCQQSTPQRFEDFSLVEARQ